MIFPKRKSIHYPPKTVETQRRQCKPITLISTFLEPKRVGIGCGTLHYILCMVKFIYRISSPHVCLMVVTSPLNPTSKSSSPSRQLIMQTSTSHKFTIIYYLEVMTLIVGWRSQYDTQIIQSNELILMEEAKRLPQFLPSVLLISNKQLFLQERIFHSFGSPKLVYRGCQGRNYGATNLCLQIRKLSRR